jgi:hypothetical protein
MAIYHLCDNQDHRHKTEELAAQCIAEQQKKNELCFLITRTILTTSSSKKAAELCGLSMARVSQYYTKTIRKCLNKNRINVCVPPHDWRDVKQANVHAEFWLSRIDELEKECVATFAALNLGKRTAQHWS